MIKSLYHYLADAVLLLHVLFVVFVVVSLLLIVVGGYRHWPWIRNGWFRLVHLCCIAIVVIQSWVGLMCPLTTLEMWFRGRAGGEQYDGGFIQYWLQRFLFYDAPEWVFVAVYTAFGLLVIISWACFPPQKTSNRTRRHTK